MKPLATATAESLRALASKSPRVHCITNLAASNYTANMLLSVGAIPSLSLAPNEMPSFVARADSLCVNLGTLDEQRLQAIERALIAARQTAKPWVLDPVFVDVSAERRQYAQSLMRQSPTIVRGNLAEIQALADDEGAQAADALASKFKAIVVQTGETDIVTDGQRRFQIANGDVLMTRVTGLGCASSALLAAFLAVAENPMEAAVHAQLSIGVAGELAARQAPGPGSFQWSLLDWLYRLDEAALHQHAKVY
ncbi:MAG: hydroxyethylthiazole kinase [Gammaproteobacteria bacterium]|nr:hydroxyethylthiazole kinase [Gammaproteobacteria bacterium]MCP5458093.1 hydroxyethylthiazole kinase [Gammaproteobacteria bacterium]